MLQMKLFGQQHHLLMIKNMFGLLTLKKVLETLKVDTIVDMLDVYKKSKFTLLLLSVLVMQNLYASRPCAVAGSFYSADKNQLLADVNSLLKDAKQYPQKEINAIIVPHAGYVFSAAVAANAYKTLHKKYKNIFLIGSSHSVNINAASIYTQGDYETPLGNVKVNHEIIDSLLKNSKYFTYNPTAHTKEHTLEVQLPFLKSIYSEELHIVPIIMATSNLETIIAIAKVLQPYFKSENLFVISTDLSHYPSYEDANIVDMRILNSLKKNSPQAFIDAID